jgi:hypothetical protein
MSAKGNKKLAVYGGIAALGIMSLPLVIPASPPTEYHHCVVRQVDVDSDGWRVVVEAEVGSTWVFDTPEYRKPGSTLYVGLTKKGWRLCDPPK